MYSSRSLCLPIDLHLIIADDDAVFLTARSAPSRATSPSSGLPRHGPAGPAWQLPAGPLRLGEPARETAVRLAAELAGVRTRESDVRLAHTAHHRLGGEERLSLYFRVTSWSPISDAVTEAKIQSCWRPLADLPESLDDLDRAALLLWHRGEPYSEPGWQPVRPPAPGGLSPLREALRAF